jgi:hypothetical protein
MPTQRTLVSLETPVRRVLHRMAKASRLSVSSLCRDLIREALETREDAYWNRLAAGREKNFHWRDGLTHDAVWNTK